MMVVVGCHANNWGIRLGLVRGGMGLEGEGGAERYGKGDCIGGDKNPILKHVQR